MWWKAGGGGLNGDRGGDEEEVKVRRASGRIMMVIWASRHQPQWAGRMMVTKQQTAFKSVIRIMVIVEGDEVNER